jgi:hypothetical protein
MPENAVADLDVAGFVVAGIVTSSLAPGEAR